jgi:hypothetical protein
VAATNAITLNGAIVCADAAARAAGCQPINIFGGAAPSSAALAYVTPENGPFQHTRLTQASTSRVSRSISGRARFRSPLAANIAVNTTG